MNLELAQKEREIFATVSSEFGYSLPTSLQKQVIDLTLQESGISKADLDGDPDNQQEYLTKLKRWAEGFTLTYKYMPPTSASNAQPAGAKRGPYVKTYERRRHLVEFVIDSWTRDNRSRINWEQVTTEWNEAHPYDRFEKLMSLESLFNKAIREPILIYSLLLAQVMQEMNAVLARGQTGEAFENYADKANQFFSKFERAQNEVSDRVRRPYSLFWMLLGYLESADQPERNSRRNNIMRILILRSWPVKASTPMYYAVKEAKHNARLHTAKG